MTAPAYMPVLAEKPKAQPFNVGALWGGLVAAAGKARTFESVTVAPEPKPTEPEATPTADPSFTDAPKP